MRAKKSYIHINQHIIRSNRKTGANEPVITCKTGKKNEYGHEVVIYDQYEQEVARIVYRPEKPLSCGAHVWVEVVEGQGSVEVLTDPTGLLTPST